VRIACPRPKARLRLICLPCAGGAASRYREWPRHLPDDVEVVSVQLPGREDRFDEAAIDSMDRLTAPLLDGLSGCLDRPFALFGHSMGALIAFELARTLRASGLEPVHLFVAASRAPHRIPTGPGNRYALPDPDFIEVLLGMNGVPGELRENPEWMEFVLPTLRCDFKLAEQYLSRPRAPLQCPLSVFGGRQDAEVKQGDLQAWSCHTSGPFLLRMLPGDHFFVNSSRAELLQLIGREVARDHSTDDGQGR
jgi:medium-chain acyl-[acyl-carrier-protein] hydrolase